MKVREFMIQDVVTIQENESVTQLINKLVDHNIGGVPVLDHAQTLVGIVSDGDVLRYLNPKTYVVEFAFMIYKEELDDTLTYKSKTEVKKMMKRKVKYVHENDTLEYALKILSHHHFKKLPVVDNNHCVVGIVSRGDIIKKLAERLIDAN